ncbi:MAG: hypothetical protein WC004_04295 [Candidatus Absconditabacterales bacterium]
MSYGNTNKPLLVSLPAGEKFDLFHQFEDFHSSIRYTFFLVSGKLHIHSRRSNTRNEHTPLYKQKLRDALQLPQYYDAKVAPDRSLYILHTLQTHFGHLERHHAEFEQLLSLSLDDVVAGNLRGVYFLGYERDKSFEVRDADLASRYWITPRKGYRARRNGKALQYIHPKTPVTMDACVEGLLEEADTNGLNEIGYCHEEDIDILTARDLKVHVQDFVQSYSSPYYYKQCQYNTIRAARRKLMEFELELYQELGFQADPSFLYRYLTQTDISENNCLQPEDYELPNCPF